MPMTSSGMKNAMLIGLDLDNVEGMDAETKAVIEDRIDKLASAIVGYIQSNALVSTTVATTGSAVAQTGTGIGSIT